MQAFYSNTHFEGLYMEGTTYNEIEANLQDYIHRADNGDKDAQYNLSVVIREEKFGFERDFEKIAHYCRMAANQGHVNAAYQMHILYHYRYIEMNINENIKYLKMAADGGNAEAANKLGGWYHQGCYVEKDEDKSLEWYNKAVKLGSPAAFKSLQRKGLDEDSRRKIETLQRSVAANDPDAEFEYAKLLWSGIGVEKDQIKAKEFFFKLSQKGHPEAARIYNDILLFEKRERLEQDQNNGNSVFELARMYQEGYPSNKIPIEPYEQYSFLTKKLEKAIGLYRKAMQLGNEAAEKYYTWAMQEYILERIEGLEETIGGLQDSLNELSSSREEFDDEI